MFVLLTPELFKRVRRSRLYGFLMDDYMGSAENLHRDLPHREARKDLAEAARRIGWLTWEDCHRVLPAAAPWLDTVPRLNPGGGTE